MWQKFLLCRLSATNILRRCNGMAPAVHFTTRSRCASMRPWFRERKQLSRTRSPSRFTIGAFFSSRPSTTHRSQVMRQLQARSRPGIPIQPTDEVRLLGAKVGR